MFCSIEGNVAGEYIVKVEAVFICTRLLLSMGLVFSLVSRI